MSKQNELIRGTLDMLILRSVEDQALHGYSILDTISEMSDRKLLVEEGSLYPALHRLEKKGYLESYWERSENNRRAKFYLLTRSGKKHLQDRVLAWVQTSSAINTVLGTLVPSNKVLA